MPNLPRPISIDLLVARSISPSSLYGLRDVMASVGVGWETFVTGEPPTPPFNVRIVSTETGTIARASGVEIRADLSLDQADGADIVVVPGMSVSASEPLGKSYSTMCDWLRSVRG